MAKQFTTIWDTTLNNGCGGEIQTIEPHHMTLEDVINDLTKRVVRLEEENKQLREAVVDYGLLQHEEEDGGRKVTTRD